MNAVVLKLWGEDNGLCYDYEINTDFDGDVEFYYIYISTGPLSGKRYGNYADIYEALADLKNLVVDRQECY